MAAKAKRNLTVGPLFLPMIQFVIPIILTGMLQIFYNMADSIVVGRFSGDPSALEAIGCTTSLANLIVNLFMGIAGGASVVISRAFGAKDYEKLSRAVHTSVVFSAISGVVFCLMGLIISRPALVLMSTKPELMSRALTYLRIICLGIPASAVYNFGASTLRSVGDSKTPLIILSLSGLCNILLNLLFVLAFGMSVDGVSLATIISQYISAAAVIIILVKRKDQPYAVDLKKLKIDFSILKQIIYIGLPAGIQGTLFSISNIILTTGINGLESYDLEGKAIAINIEGLVHTAMNSYLHAAMTFTGQNYGAKKPDRIKKSIIYAIIQVTFIGVVGGQLLNLFAEPLANLYVNPNVEDKELVIKSAVELMNFMLSVYFMCGLMDTLSGVLRGLGYSMIPMIVSIGAICVLRMIWVFVFFPMERFNSLIGIYTIYPISWFLGLASMAIALLFIFKKVRRKLEKEADEVKSEDISKPDEAETVEE